MALAPKTNAVRTLESRGILHTIHTYSPDIRAADEVARALGFPPGEVFKTLVVVPTVAKRRPLLAIVPANCELDLKKLARAAGEKKLRMAQHREAEALTGLLVGGISALALLGKPWKIFVDSSAGRYEAILVSAGQRGVNLRLAATDLVAVTRARIEDIVR